MGFELLGTPPSENRRVTHLLDKYKALTCDIACNITYKWQPLTCSTLMR